MGKPSHQKGIVKGVFGWPAIHTRKSGKEATPKLDNIFIDVGAKDKKGVEELGVHGRLCNDCHPDQFHILNEKQVCVSRHRQPCRWVYDC